MGYPFDAILIYGIIIRDTEIDLNLALNCCMVGVIPKELVRSTSVSPQIQTITVSTMDTIINVPIPEISMMAYDRYQKPPFILGGKNIWP